MGSGPGEPLSPGSQETASKQYNGAHCGAKEAIFMYQKSMGS